MELEERRKKHKEILAEKIRFWESSVTVRGKDLINALAEVLTRMDDLKFAHDRLADQVTQLKEKHVEFRNEVQRLCYGGMPRGKEEP